MKTIGKALLGLLATASLSAAPAARPASGVQTVLLPAAGDPLVAVRVVFRTGSEDDPNGKEGLSALTASLIAEGATQSRSYSQIIDALYPLAAEVNARSDKEMTVLYGTVHRDNLARFAEILAEQIVHPKFAEDDFARLRQDAIDAISKTLRGNNDEELGKESLNVMLYGGHPYGHPNAGTVQGLKSITADDVKAFYRSHFTRDRLIAGLAGGYPASFASSFVRKFDALPARGAPRAVLPPQPALPRSSILLVEKDARANAISFGAPISATRSDDDFYPLWVANSYLGEHRTFSGVLMNQLRKIRGLNYGDYSYIENFVQDGGSTFPVPNIARRQQRFAVWIRPVPPANTGFAIRAALFHVRKLKSEGIPEAGFQETKKFLQTYSKLWTQNASRRLGYAIDAKIYGRDLQAELQKRLPSMTKAQVDAALKKYVPDHFDIAIVTSDAAKFKAQLTSGEATPIHYDTEGTPEAVLAEDKIIEKLPLNVSGDDARVVPASEMFEK
jgi:zinc protease